MTARTIPPPLPDANPGAECDLIMKGGITSGVVYPWLVARLADRYRFRQIGGSSAGAMAAAACAAAEFARRNGSSRGFAYLGALPKWLGRRQNGTGPTRLRRLFRPTPELRAPFDAIVALTTKRVRPLMRLLLVGRPLRLLTVAAVVGIELGLLALAVRSAEPFGWGLVPVLAVGAIASVVAVLGIGVAWIPAGVLGDVLRGLQRNHWGFCSGLGGSKRSPALTTWLTDYLDRIASQGTADPGRRRHQGAARPLVLGDLWAGRFVPDAELLAHPASADDPPVSERAIDLQVLTTALSLHMPYALPLNRQQRQFHFDEAEWDALFPKRVMDWLKSASPPVTLGGRAYRPLPPNRCLPVVVMARMSLSFPVLLSAVPLYCAATPDADAAPLKVWFSDGGIASNIPLHFFDAPVPGRPTFAVDLIEGASTDPRVRISDAGDLASRWRRPVETPDARGLANFLWRIVETMHAWRDEMQLHTPGYAERVVQVLQREGEGGLNVDMAPEKITALAQAGDEAARELLRRFGAPPVSLGPDWRQHRMNRLRNLLALAEGVGRAASLHDPALQRLIQQPGGFEDDERAVALRVLTALQDMGEVAAHPADLKLKPPEPRPVARIMPRI